MKAAQIGDYKGKIEIKEVADPKISEGQAIVEIKAVSLNPADYKLIDGMFKQWMPLTFPATIGMDFSGIILESNESFKKGDEVFGSASLLGGGSGALAEKALVKLDSISKKPKGSFEDSAALPLAGISALQAIIEHINLQKGQKILIQGGAGGIGSFAIQMAKHIGAYVATTVRSKDIEYVKSLGADLAIDFTKEKFEDKIKDYDAVLDLAGGDITNRSINVIKYGGIMVSLAGQIESKTPKFKAISQMTQINTQRLDKLRDLVEKGIKVNIEKQFPLEKSQEAMDFLRNGHPNGKVVIRITKN